MAYQHGSLDLGIPNPFKLEGAIRACQGVLITGLGISALLQVKSLTGNDGEVVGLVAFILAVMLLASGLISLGRGLQYRLRFFVGRGVPTSLARNEAKSEAHMKGKEYVNYDDQRLAQMLQGRKILTDIDPGANPISRWICTLAESVLYLPVVYYNMAVNVALTLAQSLEVAILFAIAWFLGYTGLVPLLTGPALGWTCVFMALYLVTLWLKAGRIERRHLGTAVDIGWKWTIKTPFLAGLIYSGLMWASINSVPLIDVPESVWVMLVGFAFLGIMTMGLTIAQIRARAQLTRPETEVSEYRANWQESIRPPEVFIHFESIVMANRRYKEAPNRVYRAFNPILLEEGSTSKGNFDGETIQETQPVCRTDETHAAFRRIRVSASVVGHGLRVFAAGLVYAVFVIVSGSSGGAAVASLVTASPLLLAALIVSVFGRTIVEHAMWFWSEVQFESLLIHFQCRGTYTESKLTTGKSVYDSTQSENLIYRSSLTPWVLAARVVTSWFAKTGSKTTEIPRYVLEMHKADTDLNAIVAELKQFMRSRAGVTALDAERDLAAVLQIAEINRQTRAAPPIVISREGETSSSDNNEERNKDLALAYKHPTSVEEPQIQKNP
jgi:hypothetical protein